MSLLSAQSQTATCPSNIDFESGDFSGWECKTGVVRANGGLNEIIWSVPGEVPEQHTIIPSSNTELDPYGLFPKSCPNGSGYSIRLGNDKSGAEAEGLSFTYLIPSTVTTFSIIYHYAIVLQDPGHNAEQQPRFKAKVFDVLTNQEINCVSFDFTAASSLPGFLPSLSFPQVVYKDWTPITVDLSAYAGRQVRVEFATSDCTLGGHFGYAYVDVSSSCNGTISGSYQCAGDNFVNMTAPYGFLGYTWYADNSFSQVIGNSQTLLLDPAPAHGSVFPVIINPYPTFGCADTLYATIAGAPKPVSNAGADRIICSKERSQLGTAKLPGYSYTWTPANVLDNPTLSNPTIQQSLLSLTRFIVRTTDINTTCYSQDTVFVTPKSVDTSSSITGKTEYCPGETLNNELIINNPSATVQWRLNNVAIPGATGLSFHPTTVGTYWGRVQQNGCVDTTRQFTISLSQVPDAGFSLNRQVHCLEAPITFTNTTTIAGGEQLTYQWRFSDGTGSTDSSPDKAFSSTGDFSAMLIATSTAGCRDSLQKSVFIMKDCGVLMPSAFTPNRDGLNDVIKPSLSGVKGLKRFSVYNRNGQLLFSTTKENDGWDGNYNGIRLETAVFVWVVEYLTDDNKSHLQKGTFTLIR